MLKPWTEKYIRTIVNRGVKLLNKTNPGWADKINLNLFNIDCGHRCVLGQLYGSFGNALYTLNLDSDSNAARKYGLDVRSFNSDKSSVDKWIKVVDQEIKLLNSTWKTAIKTERMILALKRPPKG